MWSLLKKKYPIIFKTGSHGVSNTNIDSDVLHIMNRLRKNGFQAYLVGGCIRDILIGKRVKDFDIVTDAHPRQIKRLFKRCYLVGKRFRLAHVYIDDNRYVEVSTFRASVPIDEITNSKQKYAANNVFGTIEEDALRRDFTINALYYNSADGSIEDYTGGMSDLSKRILRCIGNPQIRFSEDPVRIIRAARFCAQLNFTLPRREKIAAKNCSPLIREANAQRLLEELYKILRCGASAQTFENLKQLHVLEHWLPEINSNKQWDLMIQRLVTLDSMRNAGDEFSNPILISVLLFDLFEQAVSDAETKNHQEIIECIRAQCTYLAQRLRIPRKDWDIITNISGRIWLFKRFGPHRKMKREIKFIKNQYFADSLKLFSIYSTAYGLPKHHIQYWQKKQNDFVETHSSSQKFKNMDFKMHKKKFYKLKQRAKAFKN